MHILFIKSESVNDRINGRNTGPCVSIVMMIGKDLGYGFEVSVTSPSSCYRTSIPKYISHTKTQFRPQISNDPFS